MGGTARSGSRLPEKSDSRIWQFARTVYRVVVETSGRTSIPNSNLSMLVQFGVILKSR